MRGRGVVLGIVLVIAGLIWVPRAGAQQSSTGIASATSIRGVVHDGAGHAVSGATVRAEPPGAAAPIQTTTDAEGRFSFDRLEPGRYLINAEKGGIRSKTIAAETSSAAQENLELVLAPSTSAMEFSDAPSFTVAGITDWTAVGGHGSDATLRTSEDLARETAALPPHPANVGPVHNDGQARETETRLRDALAAAPKSFEANHQLGALYLAQERYQDALPLLKAAFRIEPANASNEYDLAVACKEAGNYSAAREHVRKLLARENSADLHRLAGDVDEKLGDPLGAVHEYEQAVRLDPSEQNYFAWGSELLLHRAVWQAAEVFHNGAKAHPASARMLTALGTAQFAGDLYDQAATSVCAASDLAPRDPEPYTYLGKIEMAAPAPLPCVEPKLARFFAQQPNSSLASYLYAMAMWKRQSQPMSDAAFRKIEGLLLPAASADPKFADPSLQLGILYASRAEYAKAIEQYAKAIEADPQLGEAYYRLGVAYDRSGQPENAKREFQLHDEIEKKQADAVERQRKEVKQFLVVLQAQPSTATHQ